MAFLERQSLDTDIFCLQEVRNGSYPAGISIPGERENLFEEIGRVLIDFTGYFTPVAVGVGIAMFVRRGIKAAKVESREILSSIELEHIRMENGNRYYARFLQSAYLEEAGVIVHNFHGLPGMGKKDTPERKIQTDRLLSILDGAGKSQIIVGDFNLAMDTEAVARLSYGLKNLVREGNFKTTRNRYYDKWETSPFADYAFVSSGIGINHFSVLPDEVSDHLPLSLDFSVTK